MLASLQEKIFIFYKVDLLPTNYGTIKSKARKENKTIKHNGTCIQLQPTCPIWLFLSTKKKTKIFRKHEVWQLRTEVPFIFLTLLDKFIFS